MWLLFFIFEIIFDRLTVSTPILIYPLILFLVAFIVPNIILNIRRMHDVDKSGWFALIPIYGVFLTLIKGQSYENRFGIPPIENRE